MFKFRDTHTSPTRYTHKSVELTIAMPLMIIYWHHGLKELDPPIFKETSTAMLVIVASHNKAGSTLKPTMKERSTKGTKDKHTKFVKLPYLSCPIT